MTPEQPTEGERRWVIYVCPKCGKKITAALVCTACRVRALPVRVVKMRVFWNPHPLRHPIWRWKTRKLRRLMNEPRSPFEQEVDERMARGLALIFGEDSLVDRS